MIESKRRSAARMSDLRSAATVRADVVSLSMRLWQASIFENCSSRPRMMLTSRCAPVMSRSRSVSVAMLASAATLAM